LSPDVLAGGARISLLMSNEITHEQSHIYSVKCRCHASLKANLLVLQIEKLVELKVKQ
jgi:hypothetical protein